MRAVATMRGALIALLVAVTSPAVALSPEEQLDDPALEARARALTLELKCLVCQGESIDGSNAGFARDLRRLVREKLVAGESEEEIVAFLRARYGDAILLDPPLDPATWGLWLGPFALLIGGAAILLWRSRRAGAADDLPETEPDERPLP